MRKISVLLVLAALGVAQPALAGKVVTDGRVETPPTKMKADNFHFHFGPGTGPACPAKHHWHGHPDPLAGSGATNAQPTCEQ